MMLQFKNNTTEQKLQHSQAIQMIQIDSQS